MSMVLQRLSMKNLLQLADISPFWLTCIYQELRQRLTDFPILRLWSSEVVHCKKISILFIIVTKGYMQVIIKGYCFK